MRREKKGNIAKGKRKTDTAIFAPRSRLEKRVGREKQGKSELYLDMKGFLFEYGKRGER